MDNRQKKEKSIWNKLAKRYDNQVKGLKSAYELSIKKTLESINSKSSILEIGCGTGIISIGISRHVNKVVAIDISEKMIEVAKAKANEQNITNIEFKVADAYSLDYKDSSFDMVLLFNVLHIVKEPDTLLKEVERLLNNNGILLTATDCYSEPASISIKIMNVFQKILKKIGVIPFMKFYKKDEIDKIIKTYQFKILEEGILHENPVNYYLALQKHDI